MIIHRIEQRSEAWYALRSGRVTGTSFQTLVSGKSTSGYKGLVSRLAAEILLGKSDENDKGYSNDIMESALEMEAEALNEYNEVVGSNLVPIGFITPNEDHEFAEWIGCSPDGLSYIMIPTKAIVSHGLEIKCPLAKTHINYIEAGKLPNEYKHQVQGSMFVTNLKTWDFMSYYPGMKPFIIEVEKNQEMHDEYTERLRELIKDVNIKLEKYKAYDHHETT
jgi:hypothetical protein